MEDGVEDLETVVYLIYRFFSRNKAEVKQYKEFVQKHFSVF